MERYEADMIERQSGDPCRGYVYGIVVGPPLPEHLLEHKRQNGIPIMMVDEERVWCHGWYVPKAPIDKAKAKKAAREAAEAKAREEAQGGVGGVKLRGSVVVREGDGCDVGGDAASTGSSTGTSVSESAGGESEVENINQQVDMLVGCLGGNVGVNEDAWSVSPERIMQFVRNPLHFSLESHTAEFEVDGTVSAVVGGRAVSREDDNFFSDFDALIRDHERKRVVESSTALGEMQAVLRTGVSGGVLLENRCRLRPMLSDGQNLEASRGAASVLDVPDIALNESYVQARTEQMLYSLFQKSTHASVSSGRGIGVDVRRSSDSTCLSSVSDNSVGSLRSILRMPGGVVENPAVKGIGVQTTTTAEVNVGVREVEVGFSAVNLEHVADNAETESSPRVLEFDCRICGTNFTTRRARDLHVVEHIGVFACTFDDCKDEFASMQQLVEHLHNHAGRICEICQMTFEKNYNYNRHVKHHERALGCRFGCNRKFVYMRDKLRHERTHGGSLPVATCSCGCTFTRADNVKRHLVEVGEHVVSPTDAASESDRKKIGKALQTGGFVLKCLKCGRKFGRPYKYESHVLKCRVEAS